MKDSADKQKELIDLRAKSLKVMLEVVEKTKKIPLSFQRWDQRRSKQFKDQCFAINKYIGMNIDSQQKVMLQRFLRDSYVFLGFYE